MNQICAACRGPLDPDTAAFSGAGLVCQACHLREMQLDDAQMKASARAATLGTLNLAGGALTAGLGVGFSIQQKSTPSMSELERRIPASAPRPEPQVFLHDGRTKRGPFTVAQLASMWDRGGIDPSVEQYWYSGMSAWKPVTEFVPPAG